MLGNGKWPLRLALGLGLAAMGSLAWAAPTVPQPGALNYVEGQARIGNQTVTSNSVGTAALNAGQVLSTGNGRAEFLLTPGVYMRVGKNSAVRMDTPELANTRVDVLQGEAMIEADLLHKDDLVVAGEMGLIAQIDKKGIYDFDVNSGAVRVYDGKATVSANDQSVNVGKGKEVFANQPLKAQKFDRDQAASADPLYAWSKLRSEYLAEATASSAQTYVVNAGGWYGPGWYWNPYWDMYSFVPGSGFFYSPFGFGLYSPLYVYRAPVYYPGFYRGIHGRGENEQAEHQHAFVGRPNMGREGIVGRGSFVTPQVQTGARTVPLQRSVVPMQRSITPMPRSFTPMPRMAGPMRVPMGPVRAHR